MLQLLRPVGFRMAIVPAVNRVRTDPARPVAEATKSRHCGRTGYLHETGT